ncbi:MAG: TlpA family protein disulfide reductase [Acidobacteria bacterium]|nr:TlpA family protein disulfide reductase [Acidobacteriota bacterium]
MAPITASLAPDLQVTEWLNTDRRWSLHDLRGKVVVVEAFQMLCPGCVSQGLPQAGRVVELFSPDQVAVLGLHCVFEHHEVQGRREALEAFLHEYRITFPVAMDEPSDQRIPKTMAAYQLRGTPTLLLIDQRGRLRKKHFGVIPDLLLGAEIMSLVQESESVVEEPKEVSMSEGCGEGTCIA